MFATLFVKKKISQKQLAYNFVHHTLNTVDATYHDFLDAIYNDSELIKHPKLNYKDPSELCFIIIAGNIKFFERILSSYEEKSLVSSITEQMAEAFDMEFIDIKTS